MTQLAKIRRAFDRLYKGARPTTADVSASLKAMTDARHWDWIESTQTQERREEALAHVVGLAYGVDIANHSSGWLQVVDTIGMKVRAWTWDGRCFCLDLSDVRTRDVAERVVEWFRWLVTPQVVVPPTREET